MWIVIVVQIILVVLKIMGFISCSSWVLIFLPMILMLFWIVFWVVLATLMAIITNILK